MIRVNPEPGEMVHIGPDIADMRFGMQLSLDLEGCHQDKLTDPAELAKFCAEVVLVLDMKAYGMPQQWHFGHANPVTAGYTSDVVAVSVPQLAGRSRTLQLIETSSVTGHYSPYLGSAHLDLFSCKAFNPDTAMAFCSGWFVARVGQAVLNVR
jgi:S-adenosylmethionine decarboxylase